MKVEGRDARAFTLIELLVVIAIIALLIGILLPSLRGARDSARSVECMANMRSLSIVTLIYAQDHRGEIPRSGHSAGFQALPWAAVLYEPLTERPFEGSSYSWDNDGWWSTTNTSYRCPHDRRESPIQQQGLPFGFVALSYGLNVYYELERNEIDPERWAGQRTTMYRKVHAVPRPSATVLFGELPEAAGLDHIMAHYWRTRGVEAGQGVALEQHGDSAAYAFLDGHAEERAFDEVYNEMNETDSWNPATAH
jgi:prepilin-type N-terminal cleavage/methylation domain-containing protein/prepilin-type processing-associated H-X9-DG protein